MTDDVRTRLGNYLSKYIEVAPGHTVYEAQIICDGIGALIRQGVFTEKELQKDILRECSVLIPIDWMKEWSE